MTVLHSEPERYLIRKSSLKLISNIITAGLGSGGLGGSRIGGSDLGSLASVHVTVVAPHNSVGVSTNEADGLGLSSIPIGGDGVKVFQIIVTFL